MLQLLFQHPNQHPCQLPSQHPCCKMKKTIKGRLVGGLEKDLTGMMLVVMTWPHHVLSRKVQYQDPVLDLLGNHLYPIHPNRRRTIPELHPQKEIRNSRTAKVANPPNHQKVRTATTREVGPLTPMLDQLLQNNESMLLYQRLSLQQCQDIFTVTARVIKGLAAPSL